MRSPRTPTFWLKAGFFLTLGSMAAHAAPLAPTRPSKAPVTPPLRTTTMVFMAARSQERTAKELTQAVSSQLSDTSVRLRVAWLDHYPTVLSQQLAAARRLSKRHGAVATFWCDLKRGKTVHLAILERRETRLIIRSLEGTAAGERVEAAALIVRASITAYLRGSKLQAPRRPAARPPVSRPPPLPVVTKPAPTNRSHLALELGYVLDMWSHTNKQIIVSGMAARLTWWLKPRWAVFAGYRYSQRITLPISSIEKVSLGLQRHPVLLGARFRWFRDRLGIGGALTLVMEYCRLSTLGVNAEQVSLNHPRGDLLWAVDGAFELWVRLMARLRLWLAIGAEVGLNNKRYYLKDDTEPIGQPWLVRPRFQLGLAVDFF